MSAYRPAKARWRSTTDNRTSRGYGSTSRTLPVTESGCGSGTSSAGEIRSRRVRTAYRNSPRNVVRTRAAVRTDRVRARWVRNRSTWTEETDEMGSRPNAGTMCTRSALSSDSHARTETWPIRASRYSSASSRTVIRPAAGETNSPEMSSRFCSVSHRVASPLRSKLRSATTTPRYFTWTRHVPWGVLRIMPAPAAP